MAYTTVDDPTIFFTANKYTGSSGSQTFNLGFQPDWIWTKNLNTGYNHVVVDSVRGNTKVLVPNGTNSEGTATDAITAFTSTGYTVGANTSSGGFEDDFNGTYNSPSYITWNWKAGTTSGISGSPSITPSGYSFSQTAGFSIIAYTGNNTVGATIPHGLGVAPAVIIFKRRDASNEKWSTYHHKAAASSPEDVHLELNDTTAASNDDSILNDTAPSSTLITMKTSSSVNSNSIKYVAYCFSEIQGYSKHGSYEGNGNAYGPFIYTGFRPAWVMTKSIDTTSNWNIFDNKRSTFNDVDDYIKANANAAEDTGSSDIQMDFLSNGFKIRGNNDEINGSETFIYMAFAESPFVNSKSVPTNAR